MSPPSRSMPPPPAIGAIRSPKPAQASATDGNEAEPEAPTPAEPHDESATARWPALDTELAADDEPSEDVGSRSLPIKPARPGEPAASTAASTSGAKVPAIDASSSTSGLRVPTIDASSSTSGLRAPSLEPFAAGRAGSWVETDGWDLDDASLEGAGASTAADAVPDRASPLPKPTATNEVGSVPSIPKLGASIPRPPTTKEPGSVPPLPKLGGAAPVGRRPAPLPKRSRVAEAAPDADERPLFGASSVLQGAGPRTSEEPALEELAAYASPAIDAAAIDASAPPSSASLLDALPSLDAAPPYDGVPEDGVPAMDSMALLGATLGPVTAFEPAPTQATGLAPFGDADEAADPSPSVPRLPLPGMMRDGPAPPAADFRAAPRAPRSPSAAAMPPPRGVVPPRLSPEEEARLKAGDTASFVAQVAVELVQEVERQRADAAAEAALATASAVPSVEAQGGWSAPVTESRGVSSASPPTAVVPVPLAPMRAPAGTREAGSKRRGVMLGVAAIGVAVVIGLGVWRMRSPEGAPTTQTAASSLEPAPTGSAAASPPEQPEQAQGATPSPPPDAGDAAAAADVAAVADAADPNDLAEGSAGGEPEPAATTTADLAADPADDPAVEATDEPETSSRKPSGKSKSGSKGSSGSTSSKQDPAPAPKADAAPTADTLLKQARAAYNAGKGSSAYALAVKSNRMQPSGEAAEVMALAACQMGDVDKAKSALKTVTLFRRATVRSTCKSKHDVKLGL